MAKGIISNNNAQFNSYLTSTDTFLQAVAIGTTKNWERLQLSQANADEWHDKRQEWDLLYIKLSTPNLRTKVVNEQAAEFKKAFKELAAGPLSKIAGSDNATAEDAVMFNIVVAGKQKKPSHPVDPITELCFVTIQPLGGASYKLTFRTNADTGRASMAPGANSVEVALQKGGTAPAQVADIEERGVTTRATKVLNIGTDKIGQQLYIACRWYNTKYPNLAGQWSNISVVLIA